MESAEQALNNLMFKSDKMIMMEGKPVSEYTESEMRFRAEIIGNEVVIILTKLFPQFTYAF